MGDGGYWDLEREGLLKIDGGYKIRAAVAKPPVKSFSDLDVYQLLYSGALKVHKELIPQIPKSEFDLIDQLKRASKSPCALIAEGWSKRHQKKAFKKYLDDAIGECGEMAVHLSFIKDLGLADPELCEELIELYIRAAKQLHSLGKSHRPDYPAETH